MLKASERIKSRKLKNFLKGKENPSDTNMSLLEELFPEGFSLDSDEDIVSLFYGTKRIAVFNSTKIVIEKINEEIKKFQRNKHKHSR